MTGVIWQPEDWLILTSILMVMAIMALMLKRGLRNGSWRWFRVVTVLIALITLAGRFVVMFDLVQHSPQGVLVGEPSLIMWLAVALGMALDDRRH